MTNWLKRWFTLPPQTNHKPSHEHIVEKTSSIQENRDETSTQVRKQKVDYNRDLRTLLKQVRIIQKSADKLSKEIDAAVAIALATGRVK